MERSNKGLTVAVVLLAVAIVVMSVGFAAFTATLNVEGTVAVDPINWKIRFDDDTANWTFAATKKTPTSKKNASDELLSNDDVMKITDIVVDSGKVRVTFSAHLYELGDKANFTIPVLNDGNLDAKLNSATLNVACTSTVTENCANYEDYLDYSVTYAGTDIESVGNPVLVGGDSAEVGFSFEYVLPEDETKLPTGDAHTDDAKITFTVELNYVPR